MKCSKYGKYLVLFPSILVGFVLMFTCAQAQSTDSDFPTVDMVKKWAETLSSSLTSALDNATGIHRLKQLYQEKNMTIEEIDGLALIKDVADAWQDILQKKMTAVRKIVDKLEKEFANYDNDPDIEMEDVDYLDSKNLTNISLTYDPRFLSNVNLNHSSVQIPTDIYKGDKVILNGIQATEDVDSVFLSNFEEDPQLLWQYFGSADGFYRSYPAKQWVSADEEDKDQYDVRRRGWYIQATSSPKDVMILIDSSGSTFGMTLEIIKVSVSKALDTLGNDDFVNIAKFSKEAKHVSCFDTFVQANLRNKKVLNDAVQTSVTAMGIADFNVALKFAFEEFIKFNKSERARPVEKNQGADCNRLIMIFTDGGTTKEDEIFREYNRNPFVARLFVYKVGADSMVSSEGIKAMACSNRGYFSTIQSFSAVRLTTLDYVPVVSRPMVLSGQKHFQWSDIYLDALGLGMMTTLTLPVYNITLERSQQLLGVVGTDITTKNMAETVPKVRIGPQAYVFGINSNGYILLHPRLKAELSYLSDPPNVDFLEVEYTTEEKEKLRKDMIDRKNGTVTFLTPIMSRDERYLEMVNMTYSYTFIDNTTFSVAIAQPSFDQKQYKVTDIDVSFYLSDLLDEDSFLLIAPWVFCEEFENREGNITVAELKHEIQQSIKLGAEQSTTLQNCDEDMVKKLLVDANLTNKLVKEWEKLNNSILVENGFHYVLAATQGGLIRIFPSTVPNTWTDDEVRGQQDPWEQAYYQRSLYTDKYVFSVPYNTGEGLVDDALDFVADITISKAVTQDNGVVPAVVAAVMDSEFFNKSWPTKTAEGYNNKESPVSCMNDLQCYILDDGGFIIATNQPDGQGNVGRFFGEIEDNIMAELNLNDVYSLQSMIDYQAACPKLPDSSDAGIRSWFVPTLNDFINFSVWASTALWSFVHHTVMDFILFGWSDVSLTYADTIEDVRNISCIKIIKNFYFGVNVSAEGLQDCGDCIRQWATSQIAGTNLLIVVMEASCDSCPKEIVNQAPNLPREDETPKPCDDVRNPRYRRRPSENCYAFSPYENYTICRAVASFSSPWLLLALHLGYLLITWLVAAL